MLEPYLKPVLSKHRGLSLGIWGEAGIGKSYAVSSALKALPCHRLSLHATTPLQQWVSQLTRPKKLALWAEKTLEKVQRSEPVEAQNLLSAMGATLVGLAPFVLHLEDIHEADNERLVLLKDLGQSVQKLKGVGLLVTSRKLLEEPFTAIKLGPLSKEASDELLARELAASLPPEGLEFIYSKAAGNPLFTLEYLRFLARQGNLWNDGKQWHWRKPDHERLPVVVEALIEQMLEQVKRDDMRRYVLESKAILPQGASNELWEKVARVNEAELTTVSRALSQQGIFKNNDFAHPLFREVTFKTLSAERKQHLSRRAITVLQDDPVGAATFIESAALEKEKALEILRCAANVLYCQNSYQAGRLLARASNYASGQIKIELMFQAARWLSGYNLKEAVLLMEQISQLATSSELIYKWAEWLAKDHQLAKALEVSQKLEQTPLEKQAWLITLHSWAGEHAQAIRLWREAQNEGRDIFSATTLKAILYSLNVAGYFAESLELAQYCLSRAASRQEEAEFLHLCGLAEGFLCHYQAAHIYHQRAADLFEELSSKDPSQKRSLGIALYRMSILSYYEGELDTAIGHLLRAKRLLTDTDAIEKIQIEILLVTIDIERGHYERAEKVMLEQRERLLLYPLSSELVDLEIRFCYLYRSWQQPYGQSLVLQFARRAWQWANELGNPRLMISSKYQCARAELFVGNAQKGLSLAQEALHEAQTLPFPILEGYIHYAVFYGKHLLGHPDALQHLETSANFFRQRSLMLDANFHALELACLKGDMERARELKGWFEQRQLYNMLRAKFLSVLDKKPDDQATHTQPLSIQLLNTSQARVEVLGALQISHNGAVEKLRGNKRQEFLALLLGARISGRSEVNRLELVDALYPDEDEVKANNSLKNLVNTVRAIAGESAIITTNSGYALGNLNSDAEEFLKTGDTSLWRGEYLEGISLETQENVRESLYLVLFEKARELLESDPKECARIARILLTSDPYNQDFLKLLLQALRATANHKSLNRLYSETRERLLEVGEVLPETWTDFLGG